ncbi:MAG: NAD(P)H-dependent oxidoreductase [Alphaproteobacteria bacterium]|jgi:chromate reductase|nr:NAD(P)H-dependent oxidoreductase [Alphaproteobacteria bacterium]
MSDDQNIHVLGLCGSLRKDSINMVALKAAGSLMPDGSDLHIADISDIPIYNEDDCADGFPVAVGELRDKIAAADALMIATPEYNLSVPGVLKNAIDWVSRPPDQPFEGKPVAILGASPGRSGTMRAQHHLRQIFVFVDMKPINKPEVFITDARTKFDEDGRVTDDETAEFLTDLTASLIDWTRKLNGSA